MLNEPVTPAAPPRLPDSGSNGELLRALGRLVRGLSALFWGLPIALVLCVQTAKGDWLLQLGVLPPLAATGLLFYGLLMLGHFQKQERVWILALDRAKIFALVNVGLSPFLYWWNRLPGNPFYGAMVELMSLSGIFFLFSLNPALLRLTAMLPDETLRMESRLFTTVNRYLLYACLCMLLGFFVLQRAEVLPAWVTVILAGLEKGGLWLALFLILLPIAMTMALTWKIKEVILASVFGPGH